jgi:polyhydroxyalkanoate synthesis regulator phasin
MANGYELAAITLVHYFKTAFESAGLKWTEDNQQEITEAIADLEQAVFDDYDSRIEALENRLDKLSNI